MEIHKEITAKFTQMQIEFIQKMYWDFVKSQRGEFNSATDYRNYMVYELEKSIKSLSK